MISKHPFVDMCLKGCSGTVSKILACDEVMKNIEKHLIKSMSIKDTWTKPKGVGIKGGRWGWLG